MSEAVAREGMVEGVRLTGRDTLDTATASQTTDGGLGDTLNVVAQNLPVTLRTALAKALATLAACEGDVSKTRRRERVGGGDTHVQS
jgi:hypothetical protein